MTHTPGPWEYKKVWQSPSYEVFREMCHIANVYGAGKKDKGNARLIAAAPEMKDRLKEAKECLIYLTPWWEDDLERIEGVIDSINALLRRIDGEEGTNA